MKKYVLILSTLMLLPATVMAKTSGSCAPTDENGNEIGTCTWTLDGDTLTISGKGPMKGYGTVKQGDYNTTDAPWNDRNSNLNTGSLYQIRNVVVEDGITNVGDNFMSGAYKVSNVKIGDGVISIGNSAFYAANVWALTGLNVEFGKNVETIGANAFHSAFVAGLVLPEKLKTIGSYAFWGLKDKELILPSSVKTVGAGLPVHHGLKVLCDSSNEALCQSIENGVNNNSSLSKYAQNLTIGTYEKKWDRYIFDGLAYKSLKDYYNHEPVKRIYTVQEAIKVSKPTGNRVSIRYK